MRCRRLLRGVSGVLLAFVLAPAAHGQDAARELPRRIEKDTTLEGAWVMRTDVVVVSGATLRLTAGTTIRVSHPAVVHGGEAPKLCELDVQGRLLAEGTAERPVRILGEPATKKKDDRYDLWRRGWLGIVFRNARPERPASLLRHLTVTHALGGVQVSRGRVRLERCIFHECDVGVGAAHTYAGPKRRIQAAGGTDPWLEECLFVRCNTGLFVEGNARPEAHRCTFAKCRLGVGSWRTGRNFPMRLLGARVERCAFLENDVAVRGSSMVLDSVFLGNGTALASTSFHARNANRIDRTAWRHNVFHGNERLADGECDVGTGNLFADPRLQGVKTGWDVDDVRAPLAGLELTSGSPATGRASDGGDPGPAGKCGHAVGARAWRPAAPAAPRLLMLGPLATLRGGDALPARVQRARPGARVGKAWWAVMRPDAEGLLHALRLGVKEGDTVVVAVPFGVKGAGGRSLDGAIEINADGTIQATLDGKPMTLPERRVRAGSRGVMATAALRNGSHLLVVRWTPSGMAPRCGVAVTPPPKATVAFADARGAAAALRANPVKAKRGAVALRIPKPFHWADLGRRGVFVFVAADGREVDLTDEGLALADGRGTLRARLPDGVERAGGRILVRGLRDAAGRTLAGQPAEIAVE